MFKLIVLLLFMVLLSGCDKNTNQDNGNTSTDQKSQVTETQKPTNTPVPQNDVLDGKIIPNDNMCSQITKEFVTKVTGVSIARVGTINDFSITACDFYLTNENNSPYILVVLNKNLKVEVQKSFVLKQNMTISTDPRIVTDHYIVKAKNEDRIVNINLVLDPENFIRIDKNVERAIGNEGMLKLAAAISKRL